MAAAVKLFWWRWKHPHRLNFGDEFTAPLIERLTGRPVQWAPPEACELAGAGSIVRLVLRKQGANRLAFWGSGFIRRDRPDESPVAMDARAVRGHLSRARVAGAEEAGTVVGDPGLLASRLLEGPVRTRYELGVVAHYRDVRDPVIRQLEALGPGVRLIDVAWTPQEVAREIASCASVVSSSMHGLIFADSLGVPNLHLRLGDLVGGLYKFEDYYSAFDGPGRHGLYRPPEGGPRTAGEVADEVRERFRAPAGIARLQQGLLDALPL